MSNNGHIYLSPLVRFRLTASSEIELAGDTYDKERHEKCIKRYDSAELKRDSLLKSVAILDAITVMLIAGKSIKIPTIDIQLSEIPAGIEVVLLLSALNMLFLSMAFITHLSYGAMIEIYNVVKFKNKGIDPDFITLTDKHEDLFLKVFRSKMNFCGIDFFIPCRGFKIFGGITIFSAIISVLIMFFTHLLIQGYGAYVLILGGSMLVHVGLSIFLAFMNCTAAMVFILSNVKFRFEIPPDHRPTVGYPPQNSLATHSLENFDPSI